ASTTRSCTASSATSTSKSHAWRCDGAADARSLRGGCARRRALRELLHQGVPPERAARRVDPPHGVEGAGEGGRRLAVVHALRRRLGAAGGVEGDAAAGRAQRGGGRVPAGRRRAAHGPGGLV